MCTLQFGLNDMLSFWSFFILSFRFMFYLWKMKVKVTILESSLLSHLEGDSILIM